MALTVGELRKYLSDESISDDTIFGIMEFANNNSIKTLSPKRFLLVDSGVKGWDKKMLIVNQMGTHWNNEDWGKRNDSKIIGVLLV